MKIKLVATCLFGLEKFLGEEIDKLGFNRLDTIDGRVYFEGEEWAIPRANINLRFAERVFIHIGSFTATSFVELFDGTYNLPLEDYIGKSDVFPVSGHSIKSKLFSIPDCQSIVKKAVCKRMSEKYHIEWLSESSETKYSIEFFILKDKVDIMIDTSGVPLHKRGYRPQSVVAPLRETLAAAIAENSRPREDVLIWDPFCGSGTIAIESAMILKNIAPGLKRDFVSEKFPFIDKKHWQTEREEAESRINTNANFEIYASDIDEDATDITYENAVRAGVEEHLNIFCADARKIEKPNRKGTIICNPPYGERLMSVPEVEALYRDMGKCFQSFDPWQIYVLTSHEGFERLYGRRADKIRKLYNGMIPCNLYQYFKPRFSKDKK